ncbi:MAG: hypothetical protein JWQ94_4236 [Tardiphaga sp.]|jgi:hypothetical protein|nr:hypothetical protein [Tardiphaga sp.]
MTRCFSEPTIDDLLDDTLTQGLMRADGVDVSALKTMLLGLAAQIEHRPAVQHDRYIPAGGVWARNPVALRDMPVATANTSRDACRC